MDEDRRRRLLSTQRGILFRNNRTVSGTGEGPFRPYGTSFGAGDTVGVLVDCDAGSVEFFVNFISRGVAFRGLRDPVSPSESSAHTKENLQTNILPPFPTTLLPTVVCPARASLSPSFMTAWSIRCKSAS